MEEWNIRVNTVLMEQDGVEIGQRIARIYQAMEKLDISLAGLEGFWVGAAKEAFGATVRREWEQLEAARYQLEIWWEKLERMRNLYQSCERQVIDEIAAIRP